jgi:hypothetical protein
MGRKPTERRKPRLKKETVRVLDQAILSPHDLAQVAGGGRKASCPCETCPD